MHQSSAISRIQEGMYLRVASENGNPIEQLEVSLLSETQMLTFQTSIYYTIWALRTSLEPSGNHESKLLWLQRFDKSIDVYRNMKHELWMRFDPGFLQMKLHETDSKVCEFLELKPVRTDSKQAPHVEVHVRVVDCSGHLPSRNLPRSHRHSDNFPPALGQSILRWQSKTIQKLTWFAIVGYITFSKKDQLS